MPTSFPMSNPWVDNEFLNAAKLAARITTPINDLAATVAPISTRTGGRASTNVAQAITAATTTALTNNGTAAWTAAEDSGGFVSATGGTNTPLVIPAAMGGLYIVGVHIAMSATATTRGFAELRINGTGFPGSHTGRSVFTADAGTGYSTVVPLSPGDTIGANVYNNIAANANTGCDVFAYRIGN